MKLLTENKFIEFMNHLNDVIEIDNESMDHLLKRLSNIENSLIEIKNLLNQ